jgi:hypothetical protein
MSESKKDFGTLPCQVYFKSGKRNVELKQIKGEKAIIRLKFAGY